MADEPKQSGTPEGRGDWRDQPLVGRPGVGQTLPERAPRAASVGSANPRGSRAAAAAAMADEKFQMVIAQGHEPDQISTRPVIIFMVVLAIVMGVSVAVITVMQVLIGGAAPVRALWSMPDQGVVQSPNVQVPEDAVARADRTMEIRELTAAASERLTSYGWVDKAGGTVYIPIDRAIELLGQRGLPSAPNSNPAAGSEPKPSDTSSGRLNTQNNYPGQ